MAIIRYQRIDGAGECEEILARCLANKDVTIYRCVALLKGCSHEEAVPPKETETSNIHPKRGEIVMVKECATVGVGRFEC